MICRRSPENDPMSSQGFECQVLDVPLTRQLVVVFIIRLRLIRLRIAGD